MSGAEAAGEELASAQQHRRLPSPQLSPALLKSFLTFPCKCFELYSNSKQIYYIPCSNYELYSNSWTEHILNEEELKLVEEERSLLTIIRTRRGTDISPRTTPPEQLPPDNNNPGQQQPRTRTIPPPHIYTYVNSVSGIELNNYCTISVD